MSNVKVPVFKKIGLTLDSPFAKQVLQEQEASKSKGSKYLDPGLYDVQVCELKTFPVSEKAPDPTWINVKIEVKAANDKTASGLIAIPTAHEYYLTKDGEKDTKPYGRFVKMLGAFGISDPEELAARLLHVPDSLIGANLKVRVGYKYGTLHLQYIPETKGFQVVDADGKPYALLNGRTFARREEADLWAAQQKPPVRFAWAEVLAWMPSDVKNTFSPINMVDQLPEEENTTPEVDSTEEEETSEELY